MKTKVIVGIMLALFLVSMLSTVMSVSADAGWIPEDVVKDGEIDIFDLVTVAVAFGSNNLTGTPTPRWNSAADVNGDKIIDIADITMVAVQFGRTDP